MTRYFLSRVRVEGFRGINNESDPLDVKLKPDAVNSIFAANGLCKSSLFEAILYAITGSVPKLERMVAAETAREYYVNCFHSKQAARVILDLVPDDGGKEITIEVQRALDGRRQVSSPSGHSNPDELLKSLNQETALLDSQTFGAFLEDSPLDRGRSFSSLLGLSQLSHVRHALATIADTRAFQSDFGVKALETEINTAGNELTNSLRILRREYLALTGQQLREPIDEKRTAGDVIQCLNDVPLLTGQFPTAEIDQIDFEKIRELVRDAEHSEDQESLKATVGSIAILESLAATGDERLEQENIEDACTRKDTALKGTRGAAFKDMYESVKRILEEGEWPDPTVCPACESKPTTLPATFIEEQLGHFERVREANRSIASLWSKSSWPARLKKLEADPILKTLGCGEAHSAIQARIEQAKATLGDVRKAWECLIQFETSRKVEIERLREKKQTLENSLPVSLVALTEQVERIKRIRDCLADHRRWTKAVAIALFKLMKREAWKQFVDTACRTFEDAESELSQSITSGMETQYKEMYAKIACGAPIVPSLRQQPGSVELHIKLERFFNLKNKAATPLLPESHRNALAISVYLSAALQRKTPAGFIILDDVTSSFDAGHQFQLMEVLRTQVGRPLNSAGLQVIILSHDGLLEKYFDKIGNSSEWYHQHIQGWPPEGSVMMQAQDAERLRVAATNFLKAGQVKQAEPLVRQHLEYRLLQIIRKVNIPVPIDFAIKDHLKVVSNCLGAINESVTLHRQSARLILSATQEQALSTILVPSLVANWVNHYETASGASLNAYVLLDVLDTSEKFSDCFKYDCSCSSAGQVTRRFYRNLRERRCGCP